MLKLIFVASIFNAQPLLAGTIHTDAANTGNISGAMTSDGVIFASHSYVAFGSSLTLQGNAGYIDMQSSITASSFWGDGRHLSDIGIISGTQSFSGAATFTSTFTIQSGGRQISLSTGVSATNISISPSGNVTFFPFLHIASFTSIDTYETTITSLTVCVPGSTITLVTGGGRVAVDFTGQIYADILGSASFLQDGQYAGNLSGEAGLSNTRFNKGVDGFTYLTDILPAGLHSYCLTLAELSGVANKFVGLIGAPTAGIGRNLFSVKEIK